MTLLRTQTRADQRRSLHEAYRRANKNFWSKAKLRKMRTRDGGSPPSSGKTWYTACPCEYRDGLMGRRVNAEMARRIQSRNRRGVGEPRQ